MPDREDTHPLPSPTPAAPDRVLLVDDQASFCEEVVALLDGSGIEVVIQHSLVDAAPLLSEHWLAILLDLGLPPHSGLEALEQVRAETIVPIIVLTGLADRVSAREVVRAGARSCLFKHELERRVLERTIWEAHEEHQRRQETDDDSRMVAAQLRVSRRTAELLEQVLANQTALRQQMLPTPKPRVRDLIRKLGTEEGQAAAKDQIQGVGKIAVRIIAEAAIIIGAVRAALEL